MVTKDPRKKPELSRAEQQIMAALWACGGPATRHEIELKVQGGCAWASTTMVSFLQRLCQKGFVQARRQANRNLYTPLVSRRQYAAAEAARLCKVLADDSLTELVRQMALADRVSLTELDRLQSSLEGIIMDHPRYNYEYDGWERTN